MPTSRLERDLRADLHAPPARAAGADQAVGERHREARTRAPQRAAPRGSSCRRRRRRLATSSVTSSSGELAAVVVTIVPAPSMQASDPLDLGFACVDIYAITSTRRSAGVSRPSRSSTSRSARIETSSWSSVGSRVVSRCSQRPGREHRHHEAVVGVLAGEADQLVGDARDQRQEHDARDDDPASAAAAGRTARRRRREHDDPEEEGRAAARVDQRVALRDLGGQLLAGLVGVDRLVLGCVVLEHALERRDQAEQRQIADEDRRRGSVPSTITNQMPLEIGSVSASSAGPTLKTIEREADRDREGEEERPAAELGGLAPRPRPPSSRSSATA